jgi:hypothetical protein
MENGIFSKLLSWLTLPSEHEDSTVKEWFAFLVLILIVSFLWSTVVKQID